MKEDAARELPHRTTELALEACPATRGSTSCGRSSAPGTLPDDVEERILEHAEGNPFFLEELVRSLVDAGSLVRDGDDWRFDHRAELEIPPTVEKVILARIDRLDAHPRDVLTAASVLGREFGLLAARGRERRRRRAGIALALMRLDLLREARRWPEPEYRFKHALIQEAAYRTLVVDERRRCTAKAATWLEERYAGREDEVAGLLAHHWLAAEDEDKAVAYLTRAGDARARSTRSTRRSGTTASCCRSWSVAASGTRSRLVLFKLALALHMSLRFAEANETYQRAFDLWTPPEGQPSPDRQRSGSPRASCPTTPTRGRRSRGPTSSSACSCSTASSRRGRSGRSCPRSRSGGRSRRRAPLRVPPPRGPRWSDGEPLTAHDVEFGIKRVLNPTRPGRRWRSTSSSRTARTTTCAGRPTPTLIGVGPWTT